MGSILSTSEGGRHNLHVDLRLLFASRLVIAHALAWLDANISIQLALLDFGIMVIPVACFAARNKFCLP